MINMSAGQTMMLPSCRRALAGQMETPIYYPPYWAVEEETLELTRTLLGTSGDVLLLAGSATYGEEAALRSLLEPGARVVVINGGVFGQVAADIVGIIGCEPVEIRVPCGAPADLDQVRAALADDRVRGLFAVHIETSTGTVFPIAELGALARERDVLFFVDAVSSVGGTAFEMDAWGVDVAVASPQKCLSGPQGLAVVAVGDRAWRALEARTAPVDSLCLDLAVWRRYHDTKVRAMHRAWRENTREPRVRGRAQHEPSPSGPLVRGFHGALLDILREGPEHYRRRHEVSAQAVRAALQALGLRLVADPAVASPVVTVCYLPAGTYEKDFRERLLDGWGVAVGNGEIGDDNIRIGTMGLSAQPRYVLPAIHAIEAVLQDFGHPVEPGSGARAAHAVFGAHRDVNWSKAP